MNFKILALSLCFIGAAACTKSDSKSDAKPAGDGAGKTTPASDTTGGQTNSPGSVPGTLPVLGTWAPAAMEDAGISFSFKIKIEANRVTLSQTCSKNGKSATAVVSSPAIVDATTIETTSEDSKTAVAEGTDGNTTEKITCEAQISKEKNNYRIQDGQLILTNQQGEESPPFKRVK